MRYRGIGKALFLLTLFIGLCNPGGAQAVFNPHFIISDAELFNWQDWTSRDIQKFLEIKGSWLSTYRTTDASGTVKDAAEIIAEAASRHQINPKFLLVTLQKEQSLVTDDRPSQRQLDWATGYGVCDGCYLSDPNVQKFRGFATQVDSTGGLLRWYYDNRDKPLVKKKDTPVRIDGQAIVPQSWATAFLYTYTPHLSGNRSFWRIWNTWFEAVYPNGTLWHDHITNHYWLLQDGRRRRFKNYSILISRADPNSAVSVSETTLLNYPVGPEISFPNYSLLTTGEATYLLDYDVIRPFASAEVVRQLGYNPDELISVTTADLAAFPVGSVITTSSSAPQGVIYEISDAPGTYYLLKEGTLHSITDKSIITINYRNLPITKKSLSELAIFQATDQPVTFKDGALIQVAGSPLRYVIERGKKRPLADEATFQALGYKAEQVTAVPRILAASIPDGEALFINLELISTTTKFLGDIKAPVEDKVKPKIQLNSYLVAEFPTGRILSGKNIDKSYPFGGLAQISAAYEVISQLGKPSGTSTYQAARHGLAGKRLGWREGDRLDQSDLLYLMLWGASPSATHLLTAATGLTEAEVVQHLQTRLANWGVDNTSILDIIGAKRQNSSTARDILKIATKTWSHSAVLPFLGRSSLTMQVMAGSGAPRRLTVKHPFGLWFRPHPAYRLLASQSTLLPNKTAASVMLIEAKDSGRRYLIVALGEKNASPAFAESNRLATWAAKQSPSLATGN